MKPEALATIIGAAMNTPPLRHAAVSGHCDAFALALVDLLENRGIAAMPLVIERECNHHGQVIDTNPMSHVVVEALGTTWDFGGEGAEAKWESSWIPDGEGRDTFSSYALTVQKLHALRNKLDKRPVDATWQRAFSRRLHAALAAMPTLALQPAKTTGY